MDDIIIRVTARTQVTAQLIKTACRTAARIRIATSTAMHEAVAGPAANNSATTRLDTAAATTELLAMFVRGTEASELDRTATSAGKGLQMARFMFKWTTTLANFSLQERPGLSWRHGSRQVTCTF